MKFYRRQILSPARFWIIVCPNPPEGVSLYKPMGDPPRLFYRKCDCEAAIDRSEIRDILAPMCVRLTANHSGFNQVKRPAPVAHRPAPTSGIEATAPDQGATQ